MNRGDSILFCTYRFHIQNLSLFLYSIVILLYSQVISFILGVFGLLVVIDIHSIHNCHNCLVIFVLIHNKSHITTIKLYPTIIIFLTP